MEFPGNDLLADTGLPIDNHAERGIGHHLYEFPYVLDGRAVSDQLSAHRLPFSHGCSLGAWGTGERLLELSKAVLCVELPEFRKQGVSEIYLETLLPETLEPLHGLLPLCLGEVEGYLEMTEETVGF